ncbi:hypothetical protein [Spiroplasma endosymbiont of Notiophilus biguttatus]|uniref:hypothetical protein n=1 Tax=Spiroplasma endosymbiont of Notiophilus biguttatus TaxID=3066285 RepID=UPI00313E88B1
MPIQNYQSINGDIENVNSNENIATTFSSIRKNALKKLIIHGFKLGCLCCVGALFTAYIENEMTSDRFNSFWEFLKQFKNYLSWGLASIGFGIILDKTAFSYFDAVIIDIKELITGEKIFTSEELVAEKIKELEEKIKKLQDKEIENREEIKLFKENIWKEIVVSKDCSKCKVNDENFYTNNFVKEDFNYNIKYINNFVYSNEFERQKINVDNQFSRSSSKSKSAKL